MTTDSNEPAGEAVPKKIAVSAVAETLNRAMQFWQGEALLRASQVDELAAQVSRLTRAIETIDAERQEKADGDPA